MITPVIVANNFIMRALNEGIPLSPMKLQKLIYFLYRDYLQETGEKLFYEPFEAWQYGPVVASVYDEFKGFGARTITRFARDSLGDVYTATEDGEFGKCLERVWEEYKNFSGWNLSLLTHQADTAWRKAIETNSRNLTDEDIRNEQRQHEYTSIF